MLLRIRFPKSLHASEKMYRLRLRLDLTSFDVKFIQK